MPVITKESFYLAGHKKLDNAVLSRLISLIESQNSSHQKIVDSILKKVKVTPCYVLGVTGTPGAGKSTLINQLGIDILSKNSNIKLAIIAIDPSSEVSGGSILGDKTRMTELSVQKNVFIRPIASKGTYGGVTPRMNKILKALSAWKYNFIIIETVGIGQSESDINALVNDLVLVVPPGTGDDLQAIKRGILELVDAICINKVDLVSEDMTKNSLNQYQSSLDVLRHKKVPIFLTTANSSTGIHSFFQWVLNKFNESYKKGFKKKKLSKPNEKVFIAELNSKFKEWYFENKNIHKSSDVDKVLSKFGKFLSSGQ